MSAASQFTLLVVDDTPTNVSVLLGTLTRAGYKVLVAIDGASAIEQTHFARPDLILLDVMMPGMDGYETCRRLKADPLSSDIPVVFMTALNDVEDKIRAFEQGAVDYISKPFQAEEVLARVRTHLMLRELQKTLERKVEERTSELRGALAEVERLKNRLQAENRYLQQEITESANPHDIIGSSKALAAMLAKVAVVAPTDATVLIMGETGTGKELIARAIHEASPRKARTMVKLNCSAIAAGLVESELFGHLKGAFTGATDKRVGRFELADGGTLFLDEVSELPPDVQTKLLRVLQEGEFEPVGSSKSVRVDVRVIAASNRNLHADVDKGRFRADLFYRLNVFPIEVPPLRERRDDIALLAAHFLERCARKLGKNLRQIDPDCLAKLTAHSWPGNIRDLQNTIERAAILARSDTLTVDWDLGPASSGLETMGNRATPPAVPAVAARSGAPAIADLPQVATLEQLERQHFVSVLRKTGGVIEGPEGAARLLDLKPSTARFRMKKLGILKSDYEAG